MECKANQTKAHESARLLAEARQGSKPARDALIQQFLPTCGALVSEYLASFPTREFYRPDLEQEAAVTLIQAVDRLTRSTQTIDSVPALLRDAVRAGISSAATKEAEGVTVQALHNARSRGATIDRPEREEMPRDVAGGDASAFDAWSDVLGCCDTEREREIVHLRASGHTEREIGERFEMTRQRVNQLLQTIYKRYQERTADNE